MFGFFNLVDVCEFFGGVAVRVAVRGYVVRLVGIIRIAVSVAMRCLVTSWFSSCEEVYVLYCCLSVRLYASVIFSLGFCRFAISRAIVAALQPRGHRGILVNVLLLR